MKTIGATLATLLLFCGASGALAQQEKAYIRFSKPSAVEAGQPGGVDPVIPFTINAVPGSWRSSETVFFPVELTPAVEAGVHAVGLPSGLSYNPGVSGIVGRADAGDAPYRHDFTIHAASADYSTSRSFELFVYPDLLASYPQSVSGVVGQSLNIAPSASGVVGAASWVAGNAGSLPAGIIVDGDTGAIVGTPTQPGTYPGIIVDLTDSADSKSVSSTAITIDIGAPAIVVSASDREQRQGDVVSIPVTLSGGFGELNVEVAGLPSGLAYDHAAGAIVGSANAGSYALSITAGNQWGSSNRSVTLVINPQLNAEYSNLTFTHGVAGSANPTSTGLIGVGSWALAAGSASLPAGLTLDGATGSIKGTATGVPGTTGNILIQVQDGHDQQRVTLSPVVVNVAAPPIVITAVDSFTYSKSNTNFVMIPVSVTGGYGPVSLTFSTFPPGIYYDNGFIMGTSSYGTQTFQFTFSNQYGSATKTMTLTTTP